MILSIYTVYDRKAEKYTTPIFQHNDHVAVRSFTAAVAQEGNDFNRFAEDYSLMKVGEFDDETGEIFAEDRPREIATGSAIKNELLAQMQMGVMEVTK